MPIPDQVTDDEAAMLEPMCVAVHALRRVGLVVEGLEAATEKNIVVCGLGTIGDTLKKRRF